jgi:hypothetical protein
MEDEKPPWLRSSSQSSKRKISLPKIPLQKNVVGLILGAIILAGLGGASFYFYNKYQEAQKLLGESIVAENQQVIEDVAKFIELPSETPRVTTIEDASKFAGQEFFKNAQNGDKVLVYVNAKKAILYRPSSGKIIEIAPLIPTTPTPVKITPNPTGNSAPTIAPSPTSIPPTITPVPTSGEQSALPTPNP